MKVNSCHASLSPALVQLVNVTEIIAWPPAGSNVNFSSKFRSNELSMSGIKEIKIKEMIRMSFLREVKTRACKESCPLLCGT